MCFPTTSAWRCRRQGNFWLLTVLFFVPGLAEPRDDPSGQLEIHYINVGQGGSTLIVGPSGTTILFDFGGVAGRDNIVPYLRKHLGMKSGDGIDYAMVSHGDKDHYMGYKDVVSEFDILKVNYEPGTKKAKSPTMSSNWFNPAKKTRAGPFKPIPVGLRISLGKGAEAIVAAANGVVLGDNKKPPKIKNENDRSISLFVRYGNFHYILDGDLGSGPEKCTAHDTNQLDVQTRVARALIDDELMTKEHGVDVMHIAHHGSESSTSSIYYNMMKPEVGLISVGKNQGSFLHPREDVVDRVLLKGDKRASCVTAPPLKALFQTEEGLEGKSSTGRTSFSGMVVGDIKLVTDGKTGYTITLSNKMLTQKRWDFKLDEASNQ
jgi:beta-lactamase superfamily II metal-dependent hydrolase